MIVFRLIALLLAVSLLSSYPLEQYTSRRRRNVDPMKQKPPMAMRYRPTVYDYPSVHRPVEGPMNIEQLPAMLAARNVRRYPYSRRDDPAIIGR